MASRHGRYNRDPTPAQSAGYAIVDAPSKQLSSSALSFIKLFGIQFGVDANTGAIVAPNHWYITGSWNGALVSNSTGAVLHLEADVEIHSIYALRCSLDLSLQDDGTGGLAPAPSQPPQGGANFFHFVQRGEDPGERPFVLDFGYFAIGAETGAMDWLSAVEGTISFSAGTGQLWGGDPLPIELSVGSGAWSIDLGSAHCKIVAEIDTLRLSTACVDASTGSWLPLATLVGAAFTADLSAPPSSLTCRFAPADPDAVLPLGAERGDEICKDSTEQFAITYTATMFSIEATWSAGALATLEAIDLLPAPGSAAFNIDSYSIIKANGTALRFGVPGRVPCWIRPASGARPGTVLLGFDVAMSGLIQSEGSDYIGWDQSLVFGSSPTATLDGVGDPWMSTVPGISGNLTKKFSLPFLSMDGQPVSVKVGRRAGRWRATAQQNDPVSEIANWVFSGQRLCLPICPRPLVNLVSDDTRTTFEAAIRPDRSDLTAQDWDILHDTHFHDLPDAGVGPVRTLSLADLPNLEDFGAKSEISQYKSIRRFGALAVPMTVDAGNPRKFDLILRGETQAIEFTAEVALEAGGKLTLPQGQLVLASDGYMSGWPIYLGAYDPDLSISDLLENKFSKDIQDELRAHCASLFDPNLFPRGWVGAILFGLVGQAQNGSEFELALGRSFSVGFVAITEDPSGQTLIYAAQANVEKDIPPTRNQNILEAALDVTRFEFLVIGNRLTRMSSMMRLTIWSMLGLAARAGEVKVILSSSLDGDQLDIRAYLDTSVVLVEDGEPPIRSISISAVAGRAFDQSGYGLAINAEILLAPLLFGKAFAWFDTAKSEPWVSVRNVVLLPRSDILPGFVYLEPKYGSVIFPVDSDHYQLTDILGASIRLKTVGISWDGDITNRQAGYQRLFWNTVWSGETLWFEAELDAGQLSSLAAETGERLILRFMVQFPISGGIVDTNGYWIGVSAAAIRNLKIGLYRIATLSAKRLELKRTSYGQDDIPYFDLIDAGIEVAGKMLVSGITARIFVGRDGQGGFLISWEPNQGGPGQPEWFLAGHNIRLEQSMLDAVMDPYPNPASSPPLQKYLEKGSADLVFPRGMTTGRKDMTSWLVATAFKLSDLFAVKVLLSDSGYAGLTIMGDDLLKLIGIQGLSVLYIRGNNPAEDRFELSVALPRASVGPFGFYGGMLRVTVTPSGDFLFDLGFPWMRRSGLREWDRTIGALVAGFQASGGLYIERHSSGLIDGSIVEVSAGYAVQWGVGGTANFGPASASFRAGYFLVVEGSAKLSRSLAVEEILLFGAGGVVVEAQASVDLWILAASITILASAEVSATIDWRKNNLLAHSGPQAAALPAPRGSGALATNETVIILRLIVGIRVKAEITIDYWLDSQTFRIDVETSVDMSTSIKVEG
ncbi:hypothetical protein HGP16_11295 [Rhizobium sp. P40RR-XXII]|uniref:hypothetical protein n=1 Tax=Rhizobium sp. P40RR-XXII TaxID=2726739 RepID=UPI001456C4DE|nr:hypothetical protein [Rhizobium sp. P40RR-XXII]NLS17142.1 hypothetical protein [Rhizobium sp. P40RR-XXII]